MIYLYIKPEVKKKNDTAAMTTAINEACIGEGDFSGAGNGNFFATGQDSYPIEGFPLNGRFGGRGRAVHT